MTRRNPGSDEVTRASRRAKLSIAFLLGAVLLAFSAAFSRLAPLGDWTNLIFGEPAWLELDPGSFYLAAAHDLAWGEIPVFVGHPGTPLLPLLLGVQKLLYALQGEAGLSFTQFTARNLPSVFLASKLLMTLLHLVSFYALFAFARALLRDELAALCACLGYATSLPVLYFVSRISVEPLMMICFFGAFLALWRWEDLARAGRPGRGLVFAGLASAAAVSGAVTKFGFLAPLPGLVLLMAVVGPRGAAQAPIGARERAQALLVIAAVGGAVFGFWSQWIDWPGFFRFWSDIPGAWHDVERAWHLTPAPTRTGALPLCELAFVSVGAVGWLDALRRQPEQRTRLLFVSALAGYALVVFAYRVYLERSFLPFHYFLLASGVLAVFFGHATARLLRSLAGRPAARLAALAGAAWLLVVHGLSGWVVFDSRLRDAALYEERRPLDELIARLEPTQHLGVRAGVLRAKTFPRKLRRLHTIMLPRAAEGVAGPTLMTEFEALFVPIWAAAEQAGYERRFVSALETEVFVIGGPAPGAPR